MRSPSGTEREAHAQFARGARSFPLDRMRQVAFVAASIWIVSTLTRLVLLAMAWPELDAGIRDVTIALAAGAWRDTLAALWLAAPFALYLGIVPERWYRRGWHARVLTAGLFVLVAGVTFVGLAEVLFFDEFDGRFNFVAVDYLIFPTEVAVNLWESYPMPWLLASIGFVALALTVWLRPRFLTPSTRAPARTRRRWATLAAYGMLLAVVSIDVPQLLRATPEAKAPIGHRVLGEIAENGYVSFWNAFRGQDAPYAGLFATLPDSEVFARLARLVGNRGGRSGGVMGTTERLVIPAGPARRLNVVIVLEESFGSNFVGSVHPDGENATPNFDSLTLGGTLLTNIYSTGNRTIRALETTTSSLPPLPGISIVRRPQSRGLFTLPAVLRERGYTTRFVYGGRALFDGMGRYMRENGIESVVEQKHFPDSSFRTAWGVSDEAIFNRTLADLDSLHGTGKPFYALVLSVSNHKPYSYPAGRIPQDPAARKRTHAVRYADWALGKFMREARGKSWFDSTLFVIMGDHGARVYGAAEIPLASYEVPVLLYAPAVLPAGRRVNTLASAMDIAPTVLGVLGQPYRSKFFGRDILRMPPREGRALMTHNNKLALMRDSTLVVLGLRGAVGVYRRNDAGVWQPRAAPDLSAREAVYDAIAYFNGADALYRSARYQFLEPERSSRIARGYGD